LTRVFNSGAATNLRLFVRKFHVGHSSTST